jgi:hypothetical protein
MRNDRAGDMGQTTPVRGVKQAKWGIVSAACLIPSNIRKVELRESPDAVGALLPANLYESKVDRHGKENLLRYQHLRPHS